MLYFVLLREACSKVGGELFSQGRLRTNLNALTSRLMKVSGLASISIIHTEDKPSLLVIAWGELDWQLLVDCVYPRLSVVLRCRRLLRKVIARLLSESSLCIDCWRGEEQQEDTRFHSSDYGLNIRDCLSLSPISGCEDERRFARASFTLSFFRH